MVDKCNICSKKHIEPFGNCPLYIELKQANDILTGLPQELLDISKIGVNCRYFSPKPVIAAVTVFVVRNDKFLLGKRKGSHGEGTWALPGGKIDIGETWFNTAQREVLEETGLLTINHKLLGVTNDIFTDDDSNISKHFVNLIIFAATADNNEPKNVEPNKCEGWEWVKTEHVVDGKIVGREPLFGSLANVLKIIDIKNIVEISHEHAGS